VINRTYTVNKAPFPAGQRGTDEIIGDFRSRAIDDMEWWALAWIAAYDRTRNPAYLATAKVIAEEVARYWDTSTCNGGLWWQTDVPYKNAVANGLWVRLAASLHNRDRGETAWLGRAKGFWNWYKASGLINDRGLVNDGLTGDCRNNGGTVWSYNQGLGIGAAVEVWRATGDTDALAVARRLADAVVNDGNLTSGGVLVESCEQSGCDDNQKEFKGIFIRYLEDLAAVTGDNRYREFAARNADSIWNRDRDPQNRLGLRWDGAPGDNPRDFRTQGAGLAGITAGLR
jgi:predicted alpha-1,6-mannanase (GH76 family)